ncbi:hypothetical protein [Ferrovibrio sp.]|uniref:hypothetical protein n=1 Tax=Ferrovibrio sp. TaxID=1917215 RepID=UPI0025C500B7|nr:hypothetical protein [Ferrovibrio sp.]MBX3453308.1 hypothetical protein [Ferrovibrio sp.]
MKYLTLASLAAFGLVLAVQSPVFAQAANQVVPPVVTPPAVQNQTQGASQSAQDALKKKQEAEKKKAEDAAKKAK